MRIPKNCPVDKSIIKKYQHYLQKTNKDLEKTIVPHLLCVTHVGSKELEDNSSFFKQNNRRRFTGTLLASLLGECYAFIADIENGVLNPAYHHVRSAMELEITYNWVFYKENKIDKKIERYIEYRELRKFLEYEKSIESDSFIPKMNFPQERISNWNEKKDYWAELFEVEKDKLAKINSWHPKTTYDTMLDIFPQGSKVKKAYDYLSHMTHLSPLKEDFGVNAILGLSINEEPPIKLHTLTNLIMNSLEILYGLIEKNIQFNSQIRFPSKG